MSEIPEDIRKAAEDAFEAMISGGDEFDPNGRAHDIGIIAQAIVAERERCAKLLEDDSRWTFAKSPDTIAAFEVVRELAAATIRGEG
jgi:hypothetical protein